VAAVAVLGAGVVGLSSAVVALEAGHHVTVYTALGPIQTTSAKAAASVIPHTVERASAPADLLARSMARFAEIERTDPTAGVRWHTHWEASSAPLPVPDYLAEMHSVTEVRRPDVPGGYRFGRHYDTFMAETPRYLPWLVARIESLGGQITLVPPFATIDQVRELPEALVINCTGLGAARLCGDSALRPVRGQVAVVGPHPELGYSISHGERFYIYPRAEDTVLGGTKEFDVQSERTHTTAIDEILEATRLILPTVGATDVLRTYAGLRPYRDGSLRLQREDVGNTRVVHNYGHGGAGISLAWGSAEHAVELF
jgi:D-amino-acid oxidase